MMLDKQQIRASFNSSSKWVVKQWRQLTTSTTHLAQELLMNVQRSDGSRRFAKEMRALKMSAVDGHRSWRWPTESAHQSWSSYNYTRLQRTQRLPSTAVQHLKQIGRVKKLSKWVPCGLTRNQKKKNHRCEVSSSLALRQQQTISRSDCDMRRKVSLKKSCHFIWQLATTSSVAGLRSSKSLPKAKAAPEKGHGHCLVVCCLSEPLQLSACSANWWDAPKTAMPAAGIGQQKGPILFHNIQSHVAQHFKSWMNWATKFCLLHHIHLTSHQTTTTSSSISRTFCRKNTSTTSRRQDMLFMSSLNPEAQIFMLQE